MDDPVLTTRKLCPPISWRLIPAASIALLALLCGCDSLGDDMASLSTPFKQTTPAEAARMAVDPTDPDKRREGITLLSNAPFGGVEVYVEYYRDAVKNEREPIVKAAAIRALGRHGKPADALIIVPNLVDPASNKQVKWAAAIALQRLHNPAVVPDLLKSLADENEHRDVRISVATALGQYPEDRVFQGLVGALNARELAINDSAEQSLHTLTDMSFNLNSADWLAWYAQAQTHGGPFVAMQQYYYPVYSRKVHWYEKIAFWKPKVWEKPGIPAGMGDEDGRRTYDDSSTPASAPASATQPATRRSTYGEGG